MTPRRPKPHREFFRVPLDARSLEYELFYDEGEQEIATLEDYTSASTMQLDVTETKDLLMTLPEIRTLTGVTS